PARTSPMRFDPKVVRGDNAPLTPDGEIDLPAELAELAEQLGDDAAHLAATYPPVRTTRLKSPSGSWRKRVAIVAAAFGGLSLAVAIILAVVLQGPLVASRSEAGGPAQLAPSLTSVSPVPEATVSLVDLSGPELEAWLDLMERESRNVSVSF